MSERVAIIGIGYVPARPTTPSSSYKELMFEAAQRAYQDAGIEASKMGGQAATYLRRFCLPDHGASSVLVEARGA